jgi:hypothetical protein
MRQALAPYIAAKGNGLIVSGLDECGLEFQAEKGWPLLALCPISTSRDAELDERVNWDTLMAQLPSEKHYAITHVNSWACGWMEYVHFNPCHKPTARTILRLIRTIQEDGCADPDELSERENDRLIEMIEEDIWHLPEGVEYDDVARMLRQRADFGDHNQYSPEMAREEIRDIAHRYDDYFDDGECVCGLDTEAPVHHRNVPQIPGQLVLI